MKRRVVHFDVLIGEDEDELFCGLQGLSVDVSMEWKDVTCKRCLKRRKK